VFPAREFVLSQIVFVGISTGAVVAFALVQREAGSGSRFDRWLVAPAFVLLAGWVTAAFFIGLVTVLVATGVLSGGIGEVLFGALMLIVNVSSGAGSHGEPWVGLTTNRASAASYGISKAALNALTAKLAAEQEGSGVLVNVVDPGLTATAPGMEELGARPVAEGAASVVWGATLPDSGPTGGFFRDGEPLPW